MGDASRSVLNSSTVNVLIEGRICSQRRHCFVNLTVDTTRHWRLLAPSVKLLAEPATFVPVQGIFSSCGLVQVFRCFLFVAMDAYSVDLQTAIIIQQKQFLLDSCSPAVHCTVRGEIKNKGDSFDRKTTIRHICPGSERTFRSARTTAGRRWRTLLRRWCALPLHTYSWGSLGSGEGQPAILSLSGTRRSPLVLS
jgi:hypothetical protein